MSGVPNNAPHTTYKGDKTEDAQRCGEKRLMRLQHMNNDVREHLV